jgi:hypothetical protein
VQELLPGAAAAGAPHARWAELAACAVLYFAVAVEEAGEVAATLRATPAALLRSPPLRCALAGVAALQRRDGVAFCAVATSAAATPLMRLLMERRLAAARALALSAFARAYRSLPCAAATARLGLPPGEALDALLAVAAGGGAAPRQLAIAAQLLKQNTRDLQFVAPLVAA